MKGFLKNGLRKTKNNASERSSAYCEGASTYISYMRELPTTRINTIFVCASKRELQLFLLDPGAPNFVVRNLPKKPVTAATFTLLATKTLMVGGAKPNLIPRNGSLKVTNKRGNSPYTVECRYRWSTFCLVYFS